MFFRSSKTGGQSSTSKAPSMEGANANQNTNNTAASNSENVTMQSPPILPPRRRSSMLPSQHRGKIVMMYRRLMEKANYGRDNIWSQEWSYHL